MSSIFISHSGQDGKSAIEFQEWLEGIEFNSVFLDCDPTTGIPTGGDWERVLYRSLEQCQAIILLCSEYSMASRWCFAEVAHTRALGKTIFPIKISQCEIWPELQDTQFLDVTEDRGLALERLQADLLRVVKDQGTFSWDSSRSPYPGLLAFEKEDAAIFHGRDREIREALDLLNRQRRFRGTRLALVLGASGSGKSSLLRAGVLPRLERDPRNWLTVDPFRPLSRPLDELSLSLAAAFERAGGGPDREQIRAVLAESGRQTPVDGEVLIELARELTIAAEARESTVLLSIDQFEELLVQSRGDESAGFLELLRAALERDDSPLQVVATLRSDFLSLFQRDSALQGIRFGGVSVAAMSHGGFRDVIKEPARIAGLELEEDLVEAMVQDTETEDALPLLAFTLAELYQLRQEDGEDRRLELADYRQRLGGLDASVGRAAEAVIEAKPLSRKEERELRNALLSLVKIDDKGRYARRPVQCSDIPKSVHPILERFVQARLLLSGGDGENRTLEVRHESLFRAWKRMEAWLDEDREYLLWRKRVDAAMEVWVGSERLEQNLLQGAGLTEARHWLDLRPHWLEEQLRSFIETSARIARRNRNRKFVLAGAVIAILAVLLSMIVSANVQTARMREGWARAEEARRRAEIAEDEAVVRAQMARKKEQEYQEMMEASEEGEAEESPGAPP